MTWFLYIVAALYGLLAIGGIATPNPFIKLASGIALLCCIAALMLTSWWPMVVALASDIILRALSRR
jgi:hypothetical protein